MPLKPGVTPQQAMLQGTTGTNAGKPVMDATAFFVPTAPAATLGVPAGDNAMTVFGNTTRDSFRAASQERLTLQLRGDVLNPLKHASFDAPKVNASQYRVSSGVPAVQGLSSPFGYIQRTLGGPRTSQLAHLLAFLRRRRGWLQAPAAAPPVHGTSLSADMNDKGVQLW